MTTEEALGAFNKCIFPYTQSTDALIKTRIMVKPGEIMRVSSLTVFNFYKKKSFYVWESIEINKGKTLVKVEVLRQITKIWLI